MLNQEDMFKACLDGSSCSSGFVVSPWEAASPTSVMFPPESVGNPTSPTGKPDMLCGGSPSHAFWRQ